MGLAWLLAGTYVFLVVALLLLENRIIFLPTRVHWTTPAELGVPFEDVSMTAADGVKIHGWYLPGKSALLTVLFFHGNAGNIADRLENAIFLTRIGVNVLLIDYRGYGKSEGTPSEEGLYRDADAAYDYVVARPGANASNLVIFGRSLGGGPAVYIASRKPCRALVIESTFCSTRSLARDLFPYWLFTPFMRDRFPSIERIKGVRCPVMVIHGPKDEIIPYSHGKRLFAAAPEPKRFFELVDASHNDWYQKDPKAYFDAWRRFLDPSQ